MNDFKFAFRRLLKNPGLTAVLGIGANLADYTLCYEYKDP
jgi:hypothetical protein